MPRRAPKNRVAPQKTQRTKIKYRSAPKKRSVPYKIPQCAPTKTTAPPKNRIAPQTPLHLLRTFALPTPYLGRFILGFRYEIRG